MAYAALPAKIATDTLDLADYNKIKGNFEAGVPDIMTTKGDIAVATGADAAARLAIGADDTILVPDSGESTGLAWQIQPAARVYNSGDIDPATSSWVTLTFDSERFDPDSMHSTVANTDRLTVPTNGDGIYLIGGAAKLDVSGLGETSHLYGLRVLLNGATVIYEKMLGLRGSFADDIVIEVGGFPYALAATNYLQLQVYTTYDCDVLAGSNYSPVFWAMWQRRA